MHPCTVLGANMNWETLSRRDVKVLSRDPATVKDPSIRLVFKHRGGGLDVAEHTHSFMVAYLLLVCWTCRT